MRTAGDLDGEVIGSFDTIRILDPATSRTGRQPRRVTTGR